LPGIFSGVFPRLRSRPRLQPRERVQDAAGANSPARTKTHRSVSPPRRTPRFHAIHGSGPPARFPHRPRFSGQTRNTTLPLRNRPTGGRSRLGKRHPLAALSMRIPALKTRTHPRQPEGYGSFRTVARILPASYLRSFALARASLSSSSSNFVS
jgi:hypothetical protein